MGRRERPLDPGTGLLKEFAAELRQLRQAVGLPSYRVLSRRAGYSPSALASAAAGNAVPSLAVVLAYVGACHGDLVAWERRWHELDAELTRERETEVETGSPPRQLPTAERHFAGRQAELAALTELAVNGAATAGAVPIAAIDGTAGVGKTALAVHWAHRVADRFPDGQLYVDLRGFAPNGAAVRASKAIRGFLDALRVPPDRIPPGLDAQAALYRGLLADRRMLILLDNAADAEQVRPLLPASSGCLVVVTSRSRLDGLLAREGAYPLTLAVFSAAEAHEALSRQLGAGRLAAEPDSVDEIVARCAALPLALAIVAARAATHPGFSLAALVDELRWARKPLDALEGGDPTADARVVFSWSYRRLSAPAATLFRLLGLPAGADLTVPAGASLLGVAPPAARRAFDELARAHLVTEHEPGRYRFHDLLRAYAIELTHELDAEADRSVAIHRLFDHYAHTAYDAAVLIAPARAPIEPLPVRPGVIPEQFADETQAIAWFTVELPVLLPVVEQAAATGFDAHAWQLAWSLQIVLEQQGRWQDWLTVFSTALDVARRLGDRAAEAFAYRILAGAYARLGRFDDARLHLDRALVLFAELDDQTGEALAHINIAQLSGLQGRSEQALTHAQRALEIARRADYENGQAHALNNIGLCHAQRGDYREALACCEESLVLFRKLTDLRGEAFTLDSLGVAHHHLGEYPEAVACFQRAIEIFQDAGAKFHEADTANRLGDTHHAAGDPGAAHAAWERALALFDAEHADVAQIRAKLSGAAPPES
jgi:tetratricopeptide (TPR) repeat protein